MKFKNFISKFDLLSDSPRLFFKGNSRFESFLGGLITLILYSLAIFSFGYFSFKMIKHTDPFFTTSTIYSNDSQLVLNTSESVFAFMIGNYGGLPIDSEGMIDLTGSVVEYYADYDEINDIYGTTKVKISKLNFTNCSNLDLDSSLNGHLYKGLDDLKYYMCLSPNQLIKIKNPFNSQYYSYINIYVSRCFNKTSCKSNEEIDKNFQYFSIKSMLTDYYTNGNNYLEPVIPYRKEFMDHVSTHSYKRKYIELKFINFDSDDGWILPNTMNSIFPSIGNTREVIQFNEVFYPNFGSLIYQWTLCFSTDGLHLNYSRVYIKLQDIFASIGGFIEALKISSYILLYFYIEIFNTTCIIDEFVLVSNNEQSFLKKSSYLDLNFKNNKDLVSNNNFINTKPKQIEMKEFRKLGSQIDFNSSLNFFLFYRKMLCFWRNKHHPIYNIYNKSKEVLYEKYLDISNLIDMKNRLDFLTEFLFKDKQDILKEYEYLSQIIIFGKNHCRYSHQQISNFIKNI